MLRSRRQLRGLLPHEMQAIASCNIRRFKNKTSKDKATDLCILLLAVATGKVEWLVSNLDDGYLNSQRSKAFLQRDHKANKLEMKGKPRDLGRTSAGAPAGLSGPG